MTDAEFLKNLGIAPWPELDTLYTTQPQETTTMQIDQTTLDALGIGPAMSDAHFEMIQQNLEQALATYASATSPEDVLSFVNAYFGE